MIPVLFIGSWLLVHRLDFCSCPVPCCHTVHHLLKHQLLQLLPLWIQLCWVKACKPSKIGLGCPRLCRGRKGFTISEVHMAVLVCSGTGQQRERLLSPALRASVYPWTVCPVPASWPVTQCCTKTMKFYPWLSWMPMQNKTNTHVPTYLLCYLIS